MEHHDLGRFLSPSSIAVIGASEKIFYSSDLITNLLIGKVERQAVIELSSRLASADHVPADVIKRLSRDDDIAISGPILKKSLLQLI